MPELFAQKIAVAQPRKLTVLAVAAVIFGAVVAADYGTSYALSLSAFYVLIILAVSWFGGAWWGALFAIMAVSARIAIGVIGGHADAAPMPFLINNGNKLFSYLLITTLTSTIRVLYGRAKTAARIDYVTGVANSIGFYEKVSVELARHRRYPNPFAVAYLSCDHLRVINDGLGHSEGDRVLRVVGQTLCTSLRETDIVARLGGDEFALVFPQTGEFAALRIVDKLRHALDAAMTKHDWPITFSIGVGIFTSVPENVDRVLAFSDKLMNRVKALGKNRVLHRLYSPDEPDTAPPAQAGATR